MRWINWDFSLLQRSGFLEGNKLQADSKLCPGRRWRKNKDHAGTWGTVGKALGRGVGQGSRTRESRPLRPLLAFPEDSVPTTWGCWDQSPPSRDPEAGYCAERAAGWARREDAGNQGRLVSSPQGGQLGLSRDGPGVGGVVGKMAHG